MNNTVSLSEYLNLPEVIGRSTNTTAWFEIPDFQRGYIWGKESTNVKKLNSVEYLVKTLLEGLKSGHDVFLQGITYSVRTDEKSNTSKIVIIDGQQRTTFFYLLLKYLGYPSVITLCYSIRTASNDFLRNLCAESISKLSDREEDEMYQDVFFFKKSLRIFKKLIPESDKKALLGFILRHVKFLCVSISKEQEGTVFTMMNGNKSTMREEELIKADLLRRASIKTPEIKQVESRDIRGRMAREWDEWLHWWNQESVSDFFMSRQYVLGWLLPLTLNSEDVSFERLQKKFNHKEQNKVKEAKAMFRAMRLKQRQIQDAYNNPITYNYIGAILRMRGKENRFSFLRWYFSDESMPRLTELEKYFNLAVIGVSHQAIIADDRDKIKASYDNFRDIISTPHLYRTNYEEGARWLLRCNVLEDCMMSDGETNAYQQGRKFNFKIWNNRSLEHILPKSKFGHKDESGRLLNWEDKEISTCEIRREGANGEPDVNEHSIGNLVLLYGKDNSVFGAKDFEEKKRDYFSISEKARHIESRHLIHTITVFASSKWDRFDIAGRTQEEIKNFEDCYSPYITSNQGNE